MAGEHNADQSLYDFLIEDHEMMSTTPSGHLDFEARQQQPTSTANRTSDERQLPTAPTNPRNIPAPSTAAPSSMPLSALADQSRVESRPQPHNLDLHAQSVPTTGSFFARPPLPTSVGHFPIDWNLYGTAHPALHLNPSPFHFEVPPSNGIIPQLPNHPPTDPALAYGTDLVSPTSIHHGSHNQYPYGVPWDDGTGHESATPRVTTPAAQISNNPWVDPEEAQNMEEGASASRGKQNSRPKRAKRNAQQPSESPAGPSTEPTSPSSVSQNSRASIGSKSASIASTGSTTSSRPSKLRSASRTSKNNVNKPTDTPEERRTRASHNLVEKQYRNRLNAQFESLLSALPEQIRSGGDGEESEGPVDFGDRRVSKGEVLEMARKHIESLERERDQLEKEKNALLGNLRQLKGSVSEEGTSDGQRSGTPIDFNISMDDEDAHEEEEDLEK
ncbi:Fc.00g006710.m01.CDS01 [Cosmosporella sp. VM-42]